MSVPTRSPFPKPCHVSTMYTTGWAWRIHPRLYVLPSDLAEGVSEVVLSVEDLRYRGELVLYLPSDGIALVWCREDLPVEIVSISDKQLVEVVHFCTAFSEPVSWMQAEVWDSDHAAFWGFDEELALVSYLCPGKGKADGIRMASLFTKELLAAWDHGEMAKVWQCIPCGLLEATAERHVRCQNCRQQKQLATFATEDQEASIQTLEKVIARMGDDPVLCRKGPQAWKLRRGSAELHLRYARDEASLCADIQLVRIGPETDRKGLYAYLLKENSRLDTFGFSVQHDKVMISLLLSGRSIREQETATLFETILKKSDDYDNHLVSVFAAEWL